MPVGPFAGLDAGWESGDCACAHAHTIMEIATAVVMMSFVDANRDCRIQIQRAV